MVIHFSNVVFCFLFEKKHNLLYIYIELMKTILIITRIIVLKKCFKKLSLNYIYIESIKTILIITRIKVLKKDTAIYVNIL